jgi:hypothetical protein
VELFGSIPGLARFLPTFETARLNVFIGIIDVSVEAVRSPYDPVTRGPHPRWPDEHAPVEGKNAGRSLRFAQQLIALNAPVSKRISSVFSCHN